MTVIRHWLEADELPKCQHCPNVADERSFMCEDHAYEADTEVETLTERLRGAVEDARTAGEASMQAAFWRARAIELGASEDEYRNAHPLGGQ